MAPTGLDLEGDRDRFWNQPFGAAQTWEHVGSVEAALDFFRRGHEHAARRPVAGRR